MDGVIIDHTDLRIIVGKQFGFNLAPEQTPSDILRVIIPTHERRLMQDMLYNNPDTALEAAMMNGAYEGIQKIINAGIPVFLISRRKDSVLATKLLLKHKLWPDLFDESNTFFVENPEDKNTKAEELGITHYVDDEDVILNILSVVPNKILFDQYNVRSNSPYIKAHDWEDLVEKLLD